MKKKVERITWELQCACPVCNKRRVVTLPKGEDPLEYCTGRMMMVVNSYPEIKSKGK